MLKAGEGAEDSLSLDNMREQGCEFSGSCFMPGVSGNRRDFPLSCPGLFKDYTLQD